MMIILAGQPVPDPHWPNRGPGDTLSHSLKQVKIS